MMLIIAITAMVIKVMTIQVIVLPIAVMIQKLRQLPMTPIIKAALIQSQLLIILNKVVVEMMKVAVAVDFQRNLLLAVLNNLFYFF